VYTTLPTMGTPPCVYASLPTMGEGASAQRASQDPREEEPLRKEPLRTLGRRTLRKEPLRTLGGRRELCAKSLSGPYEREIKDSSEPLRTLRKKIKDI